VGHLGRESILDNEIGLPEPFFEIAFTPFEIGENVADLFYRNRQSFITK
jgi:hypothetical protein